jgi:hypothetical protein
MARKRHTKQEETPELLKFREKRKWQIALRRYVLEKSPCAAYAPYFGLDIENMRQWFEYQFKEGISWESFGEKWQFDHIIPVTYFDFAVEDDLKLCWNFTNIRVEFIQLNKDRGNRLDVLAAKNFFQELWEHTQYPVCKQLLLKIDQIELSEFVSSADQQAFIRDHREYLKMIEGYSSFEFEMLNSGRSIEEVRKEIQFIKNFEK